MRVILSEERTRAKPVYLAKKQRNALLRRVQATAVRFAQLIVPRLLGKILRLRRVRLRWRMTRCSVNQRWAERIRCDTAMMPTDAVMLIRRTTWESIVVSVGSNVACAVAERVA